MALLRMVLPVMSFDTCVWLASLCLPSLCTSFPHKSSLAPLDIIIRFFSHNKVILMGNLYGVGVIYFHCFDLCLIRSQFLEKKMGSMTVEVFGYLKYWGHWISSPSRLLLDPSQKYYNWKTTFAFRKIFHWAGSYLTLFMLSQTGGLGLASVRGMKTTQVPMNFRVPVMCNSG